jgi:hypothetical protein
MFALIDDSNTKVSFLESQFSKSSLTSILCSTRDLCQPQYLGFIDDIPYCILHNTNIPIVRIFDRDVNVVCASESPTRASITFNRVGQKYFRS